MILSVDSVEITKHLEAYVAAWGQNSVEALEVFWDLEDAHPLYVAEEIDLPLLDWHGIRDYWQNNVNIHAKIELIIHDVVVKAVSDDFVLVIFQMNWLIAFRIGQSSAMGGHNRVVTALRRTSRGWRFCMWVEAPLSPITYMRRLYENFVPKEFLASLPA